MAKKKRKSRKKLPAGKSVLDYLELKVVRCIKSDTSLNIVGGKLPKETNFNVRTDVGVSPEENTVKCYTHFTGGTEDSAEGKPSICITCVYQSVFLCSSESLLSEKLSNKMASHISTRATFQAWPFVQRFVAQATQDMGLPGLLIPMMLIDPKNPGVGIIGNTRLIPE